MTETEPRRYKLKSEFDADDRAAAARFGADSKVERDEYRKWRRRVLRDERDDLALRGRLLEEEAEALRTRAADRTMAAREELTVDDHLKRLQAKNDGREVDQVDGGAAGFEAGADELDREAQEIAQFLAETTEAA